MIINTNILFVIAALIGGAAAFVYIKKRGLSINELWRSSLAILIAAGSLFYWAIDSLGTEVVVLEGETELNYMHKTVLMYGAGDIELKNGEIIETKGLGLKLGKTYCFNCTNSGMLFYATLYTPGEGIFIFDTSKNIKIPESYYIDSGCYDEVIEMPEFWFRKAPKTVETSQHFFVQLWNSIFNIGDIRWSVIPYTVNEQ